MIPAFNESKRIEASVMALSQFLKNVDFAYEVIYVVEKSTDDTLLKGVYLTKSLSFFHIIGNDVHRGKGYAIQTGIQRAHGDFILFMDLDLSTELKHIPHFYEKINHDNFDMIIGSRKSQGSVINEKQNFIRQLAGKTYSQLVSWLLLPQVEDSQCGFKIFKASIAKTLFKDLNYLGFSFDVEILYKAKLLNLKVESTPVVWNNDDQSKVNIIQDSFKMFVDLFMIRKRIKKPSEMLELHTDKEAA